MLPHVTGIDYGSIPLILTPLAAIDNRCKEDCVELLGMLSNEDVIRLDEDALRLVEKVYTERARRGI